MEKEPKKKSFLGKMICTSFDDAYRASKEEARTYHNVLDRPSTEEERNRRLTSDTEPFGSADTPESVSTGNRYKRFRIHGDNIVECTRTLSMVAASMHTRPLYLNSPVYAPVYELSDDRSIYRFELLAGHGRWGIDLGNELIKRGGTLREGADSYITEITGGQERVLVAIEYCSALPAGNNAWQRNGRALASILAGIPYLYYAEIGGTELDTERKAKAFRVPNPVVPFSYISLSRLTQGICLPVYRAHPSITKGLRSHFDEVFGYEESLSVLKKLIEGDPHPSEAETLTAKSLTLVKILTHDRRKADTFRQNEWEAFLTPGDKRRIIADSQLTWKKKITDKVLVSDTFKEFIRSVNRLFCNSVGAYDIPICYIPQNRIGDFTYILKRIYPDAEIDLRHDRPLTLVWITGFKPGGDDSRPDRGLAPLARMILGDDTDLMAIVYGPAKQQTWRSVKKSLGTIADCNGLWQSIVHLCNYILIDSATHDGPLFIKSSPVSIRKGSGVTFDTVHRLRPHFSEHDTDTAIHQLFKHNSSGIREGLCNPPGGDWSGISLFANGYEYRWTSLPRVSQIGGKRPDHVFQTNAGGRLLLIAIESKGYGRDLEDDIGVHLEKYMIDLFRSRPTCFRHANGGWSHLEHPFTMPDYAVLTVGAFLYKNDEELHRHLKRGKLDAIIAFEFDNRSRIHILCGENASNEKLIEAIQQTQIETDRLEIKIHVL